MKKPNPLAVLDDFTLSLSEADFERIAVSEAQESALPPDSDEEAQSLSEKFDAIERAKAPPRINRDYTPEDFDEEETAELLDSLDIGAYPRLPAGSYKDSVTFCEVFLPSVKADYDAKGWGVFECILVFPHSHVTDADVNAFKRSVTARISRLREMRPNLPTFRVVHAHYEILADRKHVALRCIRMSQARYSQWYKEHRNKLAEHQSIDRKLADLL